MHSDLKKSIPAPGLIAGVAGVVGNSIGLLLSRLELAVLELSEARKHLLELASVFAFAIVAGWFAIAYGTVLVVYLTWDSAGWKVLLGMALGFTTLAIGLLFYAIAIIGQRPLSLHATMAELKADRDMLL